jgi:hypothetical protein
MSTNVKQKRKFLDILSGTYYDEDDGEKVKIQKTSNDLSTKTSSWDTNMSLKNGTIDISDPDDKAILNVIICQVMTTIDTINKDKTTDDTLSSKTHRINTFDSHYEINFDKIDISKGNHLSLIDMKDILDCTITHHSKQYIMDLKMSIENNRHYNENLYRLSIVVMKKSIYDKFMIDHEEIKIPYMNQYEKKSLKEQLEKLDLYVTVNTKQLLLKIYYDLKSQSKLEDFPKSFREDLDIKNIYSISEAIHNMSEIVPIINFFLHLNTKTRYYEIEFEGVTEIEYTYIYEYLLKSSVGNKIESVYLYGEGFSTRQLIIVLIPMCDPRECNLGSTLPSLQLVKK